MPAAEMSREVHAGGKEKENTYVVSVVGEGGGRTHRMSERYRIYKKTCRLGSHTLVA